MTNKVYAFLSLLAAGSFPVLANPEPVWETIWQDADYDPCLSRQATCGKEYERTLNVKCMHDWLEKDDEVCADVKGGKPKEADKCTVSCFYVDPAAGNDAANDGSSGSAAFKSVSKCVEASNKAQTDFTGGANSTLVTKCLLSAGRYAENFPIEIPAQTKNLIVEPASYHNYGGSPFQRAGDYGVVFDGTDDITDELTFTEGAQALGGDILIKSEIPSGKASKVSEVIVDDEAMQCADEYATAEQPCVWFMACPYQPGAGSGSACSQRRLASDGKFTDWGHVYGQKEAEAFFEFSGTPGTFEALAETTAQPPHFYVHQNAGGKLNLAVARKGFRAFAETYSKPTVRVKNSARKNAFDVHAPTHHVHMRGLHFFGTSIKTTFCDSCGKEYLWDFRVTDSRFVYLPQEINMKTTTRAARGAGQRLHFVNNTVLFGGGGTLSYKASKAQIIGNYIAWNSFERRRDDLFFTVKSLGYRDDIRWNSVFYNGEGGGFYQWARGFQCTHNFFLGQGYLGPWKDSASFHLVISAQNKTDVSHNWMFGPSNIKSIRFDTSKTAEVGGRDGRVSHNIQWGTEPLTIKGNEHTIVHNTMDNFNIVWSWGAINDHNTRSTVEHNAADTGAARGSTNAGAFPKGKNNLCANNKGNTICNPENAAADKNEGGGLYGFEGICKNVGACPPAYVLKSINGASFKNFRSFFPLDDNDVIGAAVDFRPRDASSQLLALGADNGTYIGAQSGRADSTDAKIVLPGTFREPLVGKAYTDKKYVYQTPFYAFPSVQLPNMMHVAADFSGVAEADESTANPPEADASRANGRYGVGVSVATAMVLAVMVSVMRL